MVHIVKKNTLNKPRVFGIAVAVGPFWTEPQMQRLPSGVQKFPGQVVAEVRHLTSSASSAGSAGIQVIGGGQKPRIIIWEALKKEKTGWRLKKKKLGLYHVWKMGSCPKKLRLFRKIPNHNFQQKSHGKCLYKVEGRCLGTLSHSSCSKGAGDTAATNGIPAFSSRSANMPPALQPKAAVSGPVAPWDSRIKSNIQPC